MIYGIQVTAYLIRKTAGICGHSDCIGPNENGLRTHYKIPIYISAWFVRGCGPYISRLYRPIKSVCCKIVNDHLQWKITQLRGQTHTRK